MKSIQEYLNDTSINEDKLDRIKLLIESLSYSFQKHKLYDPNKYELTYISTGSLYGLVFKKKDTGAILDITDSIMSLKEFEIYIKGMNRAFFVPKPNF